MGKYKIFRHSKSYPVEIASYNSKLEAVEALEKIGQESGLEYILTPEKELWKVHGLYELLFLDKHISYSMGTKKVLQRLVYGSIYRFKERKKKTTKK